MLHDHIRDTILKCLPFPPLEGQKILIGKIAQFVANQDNDSLFLLKGYAGTGKTSITAAAVKAFDKLKLKSVLLAPTGKAAKVLSKYAEKPAFTIHKKIYRQESSSDGFGAFFPDTNLHKNTLFIVDESSMIANESGRGGAFKNCRLLDDLIEYVYSGIGCRLLILGDKAQLPPVKLNISPALDKSELEAFGLEVIEFELTEVVRQKKQSGILHNATQIRNILREGKDVFYKQKYDYPSIRLEGFSDIKKLNGVDLIDSLSDAYAKYSLYESIVICRSNKRANRYNEGIRRTVLDLEEEISPGDLIMIVKNNYFWAQDLEEIDFIANGDTAEILRIRKYQELYGFRFADVELRFPDYENLELEAKVMLNTLSSETASLSYEESMQFYRKVEEDYLDIKNKRKRFKKMREDPFLNALQIKFAYAITCHKAQGGQWKKVFIDQGWLKKDMIDTEFLRWLYTAFTRSTEELELVNFNPEFFQ